MSKTLYCNVTYECDCRCIFCAADINFRNKLQWLSAKQFKEILIKYSLNKNDAIIINGGEPFYHREIDTILADAHETGASITVITNGNWFNDIVNCKYLKYIDSIELPILTLNSSYDTYLTNKDNNLFTRLNGIKNVITFAKTYGTKTRIKLLLTNDMLSESNSFFSTLFNYVGFPDFCSIVYPNMSKSVKKHKVIVPSYNKLLIPLHNIITDLLPLNIPFDFIRIPLCLLDEHYQAAYLVQIKLNQLFYNREHYIYIDSTHDIEDPVLELFPALNCDCSDKINCDLKNICHGIPLDLSLN